MDKLFSTLCGKKLYSNEWAETLDWIFDEDKFSEEKGWDKNKFDEYEKKIKELKYIHTSPQENFTCGALKETVEKINKIQQTMNKAEKDTYIIFYLNKNKYEEIESFIVHIRNGIAHGHTKIYEDSDELYIEIEDFSERQKNKLYQQSAYIYIPLKYIVEFYNLYKKEMETEAETDTEKETTKPRKTGKRKNSRKKELSTIS